MTRQLLILLLGLFSAVPAAAAMRVENPNMTVALEAGPEVGGVRTAAIVLTPTPGWHTYWKNPGAAGVEPTAEWTLPAGASASEIRYPVPDPFPVAGIMNYVFKTERALLVDIDGLAPGPQPVSLRFDYLVCDDSICVPESAELSGDFSAASVPAERIARWQADQPSPAPDGARFKSEDGRFLLSAPLPQGVDVADAYFFPSADGLLDYNAPQQVSRDGNDIILATTAGYIADAAAAPGVLKLTLVSGETLGLQLEANPGEVIEGLPLPAPAETTTSGGNDGSPTPSLPLMFLAALFGGILLNVMPCVFPVLSLKALQLARGGMSERAARTDAVAYTLGVIVTVLALGGLMLALKASGEAVGWAFQLQNPVIVAALFLLMLAIALNLAGLYELPAVSLRSAPSNDGGILSGFSTGILAADVATPCTGPFMGVALGATLLLSTMAAMAIFLGLGLGLALPFLLIGVLPALRRRLPKPGGWMVTFRHLLSVPMFVTSLGLLWVLSGQVAAQSLVTVLGVGLLLGLALWWLGTSDRKAVPLVASGLAALSLLLVPLADATPQAAVGGELRAATFSDASLADLRASGTPTFLYFTADWCITCKVNEKGALASPAVAQHFADRGIQTLVGDWTRPDPAITAFLASEGRAGVPLYIYFGEDGSKEVLPQLLTVDRLLELGAA